MKTKVSRFEYAIRSVVEPQTLDNYEPLTEEEELHIRKDKLLKQISRIKTRDGKPIL